MISTRVFPYLYVFSWWAIQLFEISFALIYIDTWHKVDYRNFYFIVDIQRAVLSYTQCPRQLFFHNLSVRIIWFSLTITSTKSFLLTGYWCLQAQDLPKRTICSRVYSPVSITISLTNLSLDSSCHQKHQVSTIYNVLSRVICFAYV